MQRLHKKALAHKQRDERGFVLATSLMLLALLSLVSLGMYFVSRSSIQSSASAQRSTEAYYYAETAMNYLSWAIANKAEFDSYNYTGTYVSSFSEPTTASGTPSALGDMDELQGFLTISPYSQIGYPSNPGPTEISDTSTPGTSGQVMYFDNTPMKDRKICFEDADVFDNCIDVAAAPADRVEPAMYQISMSLPRYIKLEIASDGTITPSIPSLPHQNPPVVGEDIPNNGAIIWITGGDPTNTERDIEIYPVLTAAGGIDPATCNGGKMPSDCPCDSAMPGSWYACDAHANANTDPANPIVDGAYDTDNTGASNMGDWISNYYIVAYAIGYVNGKATHMLRAVIQ